MNKTQHKRTAVASIFQNGISQYQICWKKQFLQTVTYNYLSHSYGSIILHSLYFDEVQL